MSDVIYYEAMWCEPIERGQLTSGLRISFDLERSESSLVERWESFDVQLLLEGGTRVVARLVFVAVCRGEIIYGVSTVSPCEADGAASLATLAPYPY